MSAAVQCSHVRWSPLQWTLDYPDLDYPDPRLSGSRTEIIARAYNDLRMRVVAVDKKIIVYMAAKSVVLSTEDRQVVGQGCLPLSSTRSSPCSQQLISAYGPKFHFHLSGVTVFLVARKFCRGDKIS